MTYENKSRKGFLAVTIITLLAVVSVISVYAVLIGSFQGGEVTVGGVGFSTITYSADNNETGAWTTTLTPGSAAAPWYSRLEISAGDYSGPVTITWQLQQKSGTSTWTDVTGADTSTSMVLSGSAQEVYATSDGAYAAGNYDWGTDVTAAGTYRVVVTVNSA